MNGQVRQGLSFGVTSAIATTLGLMVGLNAGTHLKLAVIGGIAVIAVADAFSDALGMHVSQESNKRTSHQIWEATAATFIAKLLVGSSFAVPVLLLDLQSAIAANIAWGLVLITAMTYLMDRQRKGGPWKAIAEHVFIALFVVAVSNLVGGWVGAAFGTV
jgi:hypothetical protein